MARQFNVRVYVESESWGALGSGHQSLVEVVCDLGQVGRPEGVPQGPYLIFDDLL